MAIHFLLLFSRQALGTTLRCRNTLLAHALFPGQGASVQVLQHVQHEGAQQGTAARPRSADDFPTDARRRLSRRPPARSWCVAPSYATSWSGRSTGWCTSATRPSTSVRPLSPVLLCRLSRVRHPGVGTDPDDNELATLETIHLFVEVLDKYFGSVCELDLIFNFHKARHKGDEGKAWAHARRDAHGCRFALHAPPRVVLLLGVLRPGRGACGWRAAGAEQEAGRPHCG